MYLIETCLSTSWNRHSTPRYVLLNTVGFGCVRVYEKQQIFWLGLLQLAIGFLPSYVCTIRHRASCADTPASRCAFTCRSCKVDWYIPYSFCRWMNGLLQADFHSIHYIAHGHVCRLQYVRMVKSVMFGIMEGTNRWGRAKREPLDNIQEWCDMDTYSICKEVRSRDHWLTIIRAAVKWIPMGIETMDYHVKSRHWLECRLGVPVHCLQSNGIIIHMTSRTLHNAAASWITYYSTFPAGSRGGALEGGLGTKSPSQ